VKRTLIVFALVLTTLLISQITVGCQKPSEVTSPQDETMNSTPSRSSEQPSEQYKNGDSELEIIPPPTQGVDYLERRKGPEGYQD